MTVDDRAVDERAPESRSTGRFGRLRESAARRPDLSSAITILAIGFVVRVLWLLFDHRSRMANDTAQFLIGARSWLDPTALPLYRERPVLFTAVWAPFLDLPYAGEWISVAQGAATCLATVVFYLGLRRFGVGVRISLIAALAVVVLSTSVYYEHTLLTESLARSATLVLVGLLAWAIRPFHAWRAGLVAALTLILAGTLRNSFLILFAAFAVAAVVIAAVYARRTFRARTVPYRRIAIGTVAVVAGAVIGLVGTSAVNGLLAHRPLTEQLSNSSALSAFNSVFKFGGLLDCDTAERTHAVESICDNAALVAPAEPTFDNFMWAGGVYADWADSSPEELSVYAAQYRDAAREAVLSDPIGALRIIVRDGVGMLLPLNHEYFTTAPYPASLIPGLAPNLTVPNDFGFQTLDVLYRAADLEDGLRVLALLGAVVLLIVSRRRPGVWVGWLLLMSWLAYWAAFAVTGVPTVRFLVPMDPFLLAALAIGLQATLRARRSAETTTR